MKTSREQAAAAAAAADWPSPPTRVLMLRTVMPEIRLHVNPIMIVISETRQGA